ncbi:MULTISPECIES: hypothetical protein [unclassified Pseudomonas]|uniref:hypothetical protein n=1 Tax=unclassified Pseudomonas TaxID=196821 RepID=UPI002AC98AAD|nr:MULTISPECIES: hypothetical protein [unclassified Pseudomonas]MEB0047809.1 hypothetical protein [Pseudomonas sp. Dout3]MEB0098323.1 hypothetical protein [Pseudomonas sp. DC1.2]WPX57111.1 hypothetical protein RHM68_15875 [Pseudomonas sp. DC1.2]
MNNNQSPAPNNSSFRWNSALFDLKAQVGRKRIAELRGSGEMARRKAGAALRAELVASASFIRAVVELSGTAPHSPQVLAAPGGVQ